jgi:hypothetical protein
MTASGYFGMSQHRLNPNSSNFKISGFIGNKEYTGRRGRKHYYNKPQDMLSLRNHGKNGQSVWMKFIKKGVIEDCPFCNPEIMYLYRLNPDQDPVVETNFEMTRRVPRTKQRHNYLQKRVRCKKHREMDPMYDHHHHKFNSVKSMSRNNSVYGSLNQGNIDDFIEKFGKSINSKIKFKRGTSKSSLLSFKKSMNFKTQKKPKGSKSYFTLYKEKSEKSSKFRA